MNEAINNIEETMYLELKAMMKDKFHPFLENYMAGMDGYLEKGAKALSQKDWDSVNQSVHPMIATSYALGIKSLAETARTILKIIEENQGEKEPINPSDIEPLFEKIKTDYLIVKTYLIKDMKDGA